MRPIDALVALAGVGALAFAAVQASAERPPEAFLVTGVALLALAAFGRTLRLFRFGASGVAFEQDTAADVTEQIASKAQPDDLKLSIATIIPVGLAEVQMGTDHAVQITAVNVGDKPIGVNSLGLGLTHDKWAPFTRPSLSAANVRLPAILQPQQSTSVYHPRAGLAAMLDEDGLAIESIVAQLADGTERRVPVPEDWRHLKT